MASIHWFESCRSIIIIPKAQLQSCISSRQVVLAKVSNWRIEELQSIEGAQVQPVCNQLEARWGSPHFCHVEYQECLQMGVSISGFIVENFLKLDD